MTKKGRITVTLLPGGARVDAAHGDILADVIRKAGIDLRTECGGRGTCGKCPVHVVSGDWEKPEDAERRFLDGMGYGSRFRLACAFRLSGNIEIEIPAISRSRPMEPPGPSDPGSQAVPEPAVIKIRVEDLQSDLASPFSIQELLAAKIGRKNLTMSLGALRGLPATACGSAGKTATAVIYGRDEVIALEPGDTTDSVHGVAVDVGTTTIAVELVDLLTGETAGRRLALNPQAAYGADLLSRITRAVLDPADRERLRKLVLNMLDELIRELVREAGGRTAVYDCVIAGNTAMNHLFLGVPVDTLAVSPFHAAFSTLPSLEALEVGLSSSLLARIHVVPNIKSFVGGDIAAGLAAAEFDRLSGTCLFVDLGTNGEIVLKKGRRLFTVSTAAGPAFEGMSISCGMLAVSGAVHRVGWEGDGFSCETLGGKPAAGVCGTGLIDALAVGLEKNLIGRDGRIANEKKTLTLGPGLALTQEDIRQLQLAVAAVKTGLGLILENARVSIDSLNRVFIAGAFGASMNIRNAMSLGLVPDVDSEKVVFLGNASLAGARKLLLQTSERKRLGTLVAGIKHLPMGAGPEFQNRFVKSLAFGPFTGETP